MPKLSKTVRVVLTVLAAALAALVATAPNESVRLAAGVALTVLAAVGITPPHKES